VSLERSRSAVFQSAPTIASGRNWQRAGRTCRGSGCFNPRPPLLVGVTGDNFREFWLIRRFNPRPPLLVGVTQGFACIKIDPLKFQSAPTIASGRNMNRRLGCMWRECFNPRPPLLVGVTKIEDALLSANEVSIRAHHC